MVTMKRIAELCGVSRGTVDRALNGRGRVNAETADKIRKTAQELGYEPNPAGKALSARKKRPVIRIVIPSENNPFFDDVLKGMEEAAAQYQIYGVQIKYHTMKGYDPAKQLAILQEIEDHVQALIINPIDDPAIITQINRMIDKGVFVVTVNNDIEGTKRHCYVGTDYYNGGITSCALMEALLGKTANLAIILGSLKLRGHRLRLEGFKTRMQRLPDFQLAAVLENNDDDIYAYEKTKELLTAHPEINAISVLAAGVYGTCRAVMQLPEDKRPLIIAFDTVPTTVEMMQFGIIKATIYQHPYRQGFSAVNKAFEYLVHGRLPEKEEYIFKNEIKLFENL
ncbi:MAG: LacI family DNA-binding transcriptional regulator [Selenomonas ruminantium]|jgi:LacI family transcriptional regulator|uniref:LacI family DNA-binding transcriptional regulator n=1 Tax=Selenomonas ruminantium TaxID=971 RepID=A0A927WMS3_SELRU|nr:LacI family DNA-binding transcriptional regulator [Selenomonas ruminantium]MBE6084339.1 LacI family DNA-binding transcriptional regulator [Selenomonas ruminantium]